jgi:hypothetical protein
MQYFKPKGDLYVGDCMPFFHQGIFHLYYLLDEGHYRCPELRGERLFLFCQNGQVRFKSIEVRSLV